MHVIAKPTGERLAALRIPLAIKLSGANLFVVATLYGAWLLAGGVGHAGVVTLVGVCLVIHFGLVLVALRPIRDVEAVARQAWRGDYGVSVEARSVDGGPLRVESMFNTLFSTLVADRARARALATEVIAAGDRERSAIARQLHDTTAQHLAALLYQLSSVARDVPDARLAARMRDVRDAAENILEEVRRLSDVVHPTVLEDLGLEAALQKLARDTSLGTAIDFDVAVDLASQRLPRGLESTLFRVAQEAVQNATRHGAPNRVRIALRRVAPSAVLEVHDDGRGFSLADVTQGPLLAGLRSMRERLALVDGSLEIDTAVGNGTTVCAAVPLDSMPDHLHPKEHL